MDTATNVLSTCQTSPTLCSSPATTKWHARLTRPPSPMLLSATTSPYQKAPTATLNARAWKIRRLAVDLVRVLGGSPDHPPPLSQVKRHPRTHKDRPKRLTPPDRWAMCLPRGTAIRDCESRSKTPTRSEPLRDLLLLGPAPMQAGMCPSSGIRWVLLLGPAPLQAGMCPSKGIRWVQL
jgi:hypothetical protein